MRTAHPGIDREAATVGVACHVFTPEDFAFVASLMGRVVEPAKFAGWIAPPATGVNRQPIDFEYVRFD